MRRVLSRSAVVVGLALVITAPTVGASATATTVSPGLARFDASGIAHRASLPTGWSISEGVDGTQLTWRSTAPIPLANAPIEFWLGHHLLGTPKPEADGRSFTLVQTAPLPGPVRSLRVTRGGANLDAAGRPHFRLGSSTSSPETNTPFRTGATRLSSTDPGLPGHYATTTTEYSLPGVSITGLPYDVETQGVVVRPTHTTGPRPLVLFLHGRHSTCYRGGPDGNSSGDWPCRPNWKPIPSYRGYLDAQQLLASQGYVTVSIAANGINGQDYQVSDGGAQARSELVRHHLDLFDQWNTSGGDPFGSALIGAVDLDRVMLVGHSRGGEGVNRAAIDTTTNDPWQIDSQVLIGPTAFGRQTAPGVDTAVLLPFCDGDVSDLQGQQYIDQARDLFGATPDPALRTSVMVMGANHNFFNKEWTPGDAVAPAWDDWGGRDGVCGKKSPTRLTPDEQRNVGAVYIASAARAFIRNDPDALALLDGSDVRPASIGDATTLVTALGANRSPLVTFRPRTETRSVNAFALVCRGYRLAPGQPTCAPGVSNWSQPHFLPMYGASNAPATSALRMRWRQPSARVKVALPTPVDLTHSSSLDLRVAIHPQSGRAKLGVVIGDGSGHVARLGSQALSALPGDRQLSKLWAQTLRLPLPEQSHVDLSDIQWMRLVGESREGRVVVLDAYGREPGISDAPRPTLPRVDVSDTSVREGDSGEHFEDVTLSITGQVSGGERIYVESSDYGRHGPSVQTVFRLSRGQTTLTVPFPVSGDTRDDYTMRSQLTVKAITGVVTGNYSGTLTIRDDDPKPQAVLDQPIQTTTEGNELQWVVQLDHKSDKGIGWEVRPVASGDDELTVSDLPHRFRRQHNLGSAADDLKLSDSRLRLFASVRPGRLTTTFVLPIRSDSTVEVPETVTLRQRR
ncbi:MAG: hypothetical protein ABI586_04835, partial [Candidatus Nanopelagicales bacterium]